MKNLMAGDCHWLWYNGRGLVYRKNGELGYCGKVPQFVLKKFGLVK